MSVVDVDRYMDLRAPKLTRCSLKSVAERLRSLLRYRTGINPQNRLPFLATYLGHRDINSTLVYITVTQELLHYANERFRVVGAPCLSLDQEVRP